MLINFKGVGHRQLSPADRELRQQRTVNYDNRSDRRDDIEGIFEFLVELVTQHRTVLGRGEFIDVHRNLCGR